MLGRQSTEDGEEDGDSAEIQSFQSGSKFHIDIPESERSQITESTRAEELDLWIHGFDGKIPDLRGRTLIEVEREAARIKLKEYFVSWADFNRCMDSWAVLNGRAAVRYASKKRYAIRVCRYGKILRGCVKTKPTNGHDGDDEGDLDYDVSDLLQVTDDEYEPVEEPDLEWVFEDGDWTLATASSGTEDQLKKKQPVSKAGSSTKRPATQIGRPFMKQVASRKPLTDLNPNTQKPLRVPSHPAIQKTQQQSIVRNTRTWLPPRNPKIHGKRVSENGACGQLSRFLAPDVDGVHDDEESEPCPFRVRAQVKANSGRIFITVCELRHTCTQLGHRWRGPAHKAFWLAETVAPRVTLNHKVGVKEMLQGFTMDYHKSSNYRQMWRAKDKVRDWYFGGQRASFHRIPALLSRLREVDPGCIVNFHSEESSSTFRRAFICPSAMRGALQYVQPMVYLDACHTKNRKYPTQLFLATALDGNSRIVILCYAVANVESTDNWTWFLEHVDRALHGLHSPSIPLLSDRQKGLHAAVRDVFPGKVHGHCCNHLRANVKSSFGKAAEAFFVACVYADSKEMFDSLLLELQKGAAKGVAAVQYIRNIDAALWARHAFPFPRLGKVSSNPAEQANNGLLPIREYAPFKLLVEMWYYIQVKQNARRAEANKFRQVFTDVAMRRHDVNLKHYGQWQVFDDGARTTKVKNAHGDEALVTLHPKPTCTCWELQDMIWPCEHIMAWDDRDGRDYRKHFHKCWKTSSVKALYAPTLPCFLTSGLPMSAECFPPDIAVKRGRHRVVRIQSGQGPRRKQPCEGEQWEYDAAGNILVSFPIEDDPNLLDPMPLPNTAAAVVRPDCQRIPSVNRSGKSKRKCSLCGILGHNKRGCQQIRDDTGAGQAGSQEVHEENTREVVQDELPDSNGAPLPTQTQSDVPQVPHYPDSTGDEGEPQYDEGVETEWIASGVSGFGNEDPQCNFWINIADSLAKELPTRIETAIANDRECTPSGNTGI